MSQFDIDPWFPGQFNPAVSACQFTSAQGKPSLIISIISRNGSGMASLSVYHWHRCHRLRKIRFFSTKYCWVVNNGYKPFSFWWDEDPSYSYYFFHLLPTLWHLLEKKLKGSHLEQNLISQRRCKNANRQDHITQVSTARTQCWGNKSMTRQRLIRHNQGWI